jgi:hypothetical protein
MSIGRGWKEKEGGKHEKDYVGFCGYGDDEWVRDWNKLHYSR